MFSRQTKVAAVSPSTAPAAIPTGLPAVPIPPKAPPAIPEATSAATGSIKAKKSPLSSPGGLITVGWLLFKGSLKINSFVLGSTLTS